MDQFVHSQNLLRYMDLLERETDPGRRARISDLLVEEMGRFGGALERLAEVDRLIAGAQMRVRRQSGLLCHMPVDAQAHPLAANVLANLEQTLGLLLDHRELLRRGLGPEDGSLPN